MQDGSEWDEAVVVALGSNLGDARGDSRALLERALLRFPDHGLAVKARSRWWRSNAWPDPREPPFLNGVVLVQTILSPREVLDALLATEAALGRTRTTANAPRTLDLDLIAHRSAGLRERRPHPAASSRAPAFVRHGSARRTRPRLAPSGERRHARALARSAEQGVDATPID
jgi:2-amino-4-hydroxy-6-hydroxymethyldihydropteridine diphosphokinase